MSTNIDRAELDYASGMKYKDIAEKYAVSINTVKSWKTRNKWVRKGVHTKSKSVHTKKEKVCTQNDDANLEDKVRKKIVESIADNDELTEKRKLFCLYFADCLNATQSYQNAFKVKRSTARVEGSKLLINPAIKAEIDRLKQIKYKSIMFKADDIVERQIRIAFSDMSDFIDVRVKESKVYVEGQVKLDKNGNPITVKYNDLLVKESSELDGAVISEVKTTKDGVSIKLKDSQKAFDWLTKYFEFNPLDKHKIAFDNAKLEIERKKAAAYEKEVENGLAEMMKKARERVINGQK
ncbi:terminase small subunit [Pectinatus frisingensis]|uniref:terminase small subunit n=1 Tax=Pectinatus frisingensis TaxID=865 RepID=UPI003D8027ED